MLFHVFLVYSAWAFHNKASAQLLSVEPSANSIQVTWKNRAAPQESHVWLTLETTRKPNDGQSCRKTGSSEKLHCKVDGLESGTLYTAYIVFKDFTGFTNATIHVTTRAKDICKSVDDKPKESLTALAIAVGLLAIIMIILLITLITIYCRKGKEPKKNRRRIDGKPTRDQQLEYKGHYEMKLQPNETNSRTSAPGSNDVIRDVTF